MLVKLEEMRCRARKVCAAADLLALEGKRRRQRLDAGDLEPFEPAEQP